MRLSIMDHKNSTARRIAPALSAVLLTAILASLPETAHAQTWNGSVSDLWGDAGNWSPNTVPNSSTANVVIDSATNNPVLININPTIANLTLGVSNSLDLNNDQSLTIAGGSGAGSLAIGGTLTLNSSGSLTDLILTGASSTITLSGGGTLALSNEFNNRVYGTGSQTLVNSAGNTISGSGQLGLGGGGNAFALVNAGTINANQSTTLQLNPGNGTTNTGLIEASAGGTLQLLGSYANAGGTILSTGTGSAVNLGGATITGGTLTTSAGGAMFSSNGTLSGLTISAGSTITNQNDNVTVLQGAITNNGTIALASSGSLTDLQLGTGAALEITNGGALTLSDNFNNRIYGSNSGTITNDVGGTIQGAGQFGLGSGGNAFALVNNGTINANQSAALQVSPGNGTTNTGTLEATNSGTLNLGGNFTNTGTIQATSAALVNLAGAGSSTITNTGGLVQATGSGSLVNLGGSGGTGTIIGGTLSSSAGGGIENNGSGALNGVSVSSGTTFTALNGSFTSLLGATTFHDTAIAINSTGSLSDVQLSGGAAVELTSGSSLTMSNIFNNRIYGSGSDTLTNDAGSTIQGSGQFGLGGGGNAFTLVNAGTINANQSVTLQLNPGNGTTNTGTIEATAGGTLQLLGTYTNTGGTILSTGTGSVMNLSGASITGGTLTTTSGGVMNSGGGTLSGLTISTGSTITTQNDFVTVLQGAITNHGTISLASTGSLTDLQLSGGAALELTSGSTLTMSDNFNNRIYGSGASAPFDTLTNDSGSTIQGAGQIGLGSGGNAFALINAGTINANQSVALQLNPGNGTTNTGLIEASAGGTLQLLGTYTNTGGTILSTGTGSVVNLGGASITGGTLTTAGGGVMDSGNGTLSGLTISAGSTITNQNDNATLLQGAITNNGTIALASSGSLTDLQLGTGAALEITSGGSLTLSDNFNNRIYSTTGAGTITNDVGGTIQGSGQIGLGSGGNAFTLVNNGIINANQSAALQVSPGNGTTNTGTLEATNAGTLNLGGNFTNTGTIQATSAALVNLAGAGSSTITNTGGLVQATGSGSLVNLGGSGGTGTIIGGTLSSSAGGGIENNGSGALNGVSVSSGTTFTALNGSFTSLLGATTFHDTAIALNSTGSLTDVQLSGGAAVELTSGSSLTMSNNFNNRIYGSGSDTLTNDAGSTIQGSGQFGLGGGGNAFTLVNAGTINANQSVTLQLNPGNGTTNTGTLEASAGGTLQLLGGYTNTGGTILSTGTGSVVNLGGATITGGTLTTSSGGVMNSGGGTLSGLTISTGSTITTQNDFVTVLQGAITNNGTIALASSGSLTDLQLGTGAALEITSGGSLTLSDNFNNRIYSTTGAGTITNDVGGTIQGSGQIGLGSGGNAFTLVNNGTVIADGTNALLINPGNGTTNHGTFQVNSGSTLQVGGNFTTAGMVNIGAVNDHSSSLLQMVGTTDYVQTAGATTLWSAGSTLEVASGQHVRIDGGLLQGFGTIQGDLINAGTVHPGDGPGILSVIGNYTQNAGGILDIQIGGVTPGIDFSVLSVSGLAALNAGSILDVSLLNGFTPTSNETFVILTSGGLSGMFTDNTITLGNVTFTVEYSPTGFLNDVVLEAQVRAVPEPASLILFAIGIGGMGVYATRCRRQIAWASVYPSSIRSGSH